MIQIFLNVLMVVLALYVILSTVVTAFTAILWFIVFTGIAIVVFDIVDILRQNFIKTRS